LLFAGIFAWAVARAVVSTTWRDEALLGPLNAGSVIAVAVAGGAAVAWLVLAWRRDGMRSVRVGAAGVDDIDWADPASRPRF
jgi:hypothetical protein